MSDQGTRTDGNPGSTPNYELNRFRAFPQDVSVNEPPLQAEDAIRRYGHREDGDYFGQRRALYRARFDDALRQRFFRNIAQAMAGAEREIIEWQLALFEKIDPSHAEGVTKELGKTQPVSETALP